MATRRGDFGESTTLVEEICNIGEWEFGRTKPFARNGPTRSLAAVKSYEAALLSANAQRMLARTEVIAITLGVPMATSNDAPSAEEQADIDLLHKMGYAQELKRGMGSFSNFAVSFSIISILTGGITTYYLGMDAGGPFVITIGWFIVGALTLCVGMGMAEITSAFPTAGGLYYWSARLAKKNKAAWSWATGWFNLVGQVAVTASIDYGLATFVGFFISLYSSSFHNNAKWTLLFYALVLLAHGFLNTFRVQLVSGISNFSAWWHVFGTAIIVIALLAIPSHHQSVSFLFHHENLTGWTGPFAGVYAFAIGLLLAQYTLTGYDASAHMTEETLGASTGGPKALVRAIYISIIAGFILNLAMTLAIQGGAKDYGRGRAQRRAPPAARSSSRRSPAPVERCWSCSRWSRCSSAVWRRSPRTRG